MGVREQVHLVHRLRAPCVRHARRRGVSPADQPGHDQPVLPRALHAGRGEGPDRRAGRRIGGHGPPEPQRQGHFADRPPPVRGVHQELHGQAVADRSEGPARGHHQPPAGALQLRQPVFQGHVGGPADGRLHRVDGAHDRRSAHPRDPEGRLLRRLAAVQQEGPGRGGRAGGVHGPGGPLLRLFAGRAQVAYGRLQRGALRRGRPFRMPGDELLRRRRAVHARDRVQELQPGTQGLAEPGQNGGVGGVQPFRRARRRAVLPDQHRGRQGAVREVRGAREGRTAHGVRRPSGHVQVLRHAPGDRHRIDRVRGTGRTNAQEKEGLIMEMASNDSAEISIIIPSYESNANQLRRCLKSVSLQKDEGVDVECIVIFDGVPHKDVLSIMDEYPDVSCVTIKHGGVSAARNEGIRSAKGRYISFVDADDELPEYALKKMLSYADKHGCEIVQGSYDAVLSSSIEHHAYMDKESIFKDSRLTRFQQDILCPDKGISLVWGKLFRRSFIIDNDIVFDCKMQMSEDTAFVFDACSKASTIGYIPDTVYQYTRSQTSTVSTFRLDYESRIVNAIECMKGHIDYALDREKYDESFNSYVLFHLLLIQQHYLFNRVAPWNRRQRYSKYKETLRQPVFADALLSIKYGDFSLTKRVSLFMLKNKVYCLSQIISYIRNIQLSRMN